ncbi:MAG: hypothetical protein BGO43_06705 [Gammaproteobacteria bacterium 39-13]|nr:hypothetical protein [Gammaproteobacteria bacterium]OJV90529.1 MAG: hypothetical protein BGO43_06705 [Gammaproteobacteria bacterium 39-13]
MKKVAGLILLTSITILAVTFSFAQNDKKPLSGSLEEQKKEIEKTRKGTQEQMAQAKGSADKERILFLEDLDALLESNSRCYQEKEEIDIRVCMLNGNKKLAEKGNFIAQDMLARNYHEFHQNIPMTLKWFKKAVENPRTPSQFKERLTKDINALEEELKKAPPEGEISNTTKKEIEQLNSDKENALKQKRKAELLDDKDNLTIYQEMETFLDAALPCYAKKDDHEIYICSLQEIKKLAENGNFIAQHQLANIYENSYENKAMAIEWYQKGLENQKTPESYRPQLKQDLERVQAMQDKSQPTEQNQNEKNEE